MALLFTLILAICAGPGLSETPPRVRLVGGPHRCEGRVEVERSGQWGTVCDDGWGLEDVAVVCRELGCGAAKKSPSGTVYGPLAEKHQSIFTQNVNCNGMEDTLAQCEQDEEVYGCDHNEDAGASCDNPESSSSPEPESSFSTGPEIPFSLVPENVRLAGGPGRCAGRVEVQHEGRWSTVCKTGWSLQAAKVLCRQLGCGRALLVLRQCNNTIQGQGSIWMSMMKCSGQEATIQDCNSGPLKKNSCTHLDDTWVKCEDAFELRLVGGGSICSGRLEVLHKNKWGTVCDDSWGEQEDQVVCKQLGCGKPLISHSGKRYGPGFGRIWLDDVRCSGKEQSLDQCKHRFWGYHDCDHTEDVSVTCSE
ncbi:PREDICTED: CD5 antigen-like [Chinchilla lanigera]|uniref:CD5 molecule like n=1 Tax=Chinchilla lanigera TaxID=34839 RepID=A0A8C2W2R2_CHILA|nr:PREDICTED: CD5 antigen-like [Chinchilla lanigera]